MDRRRALIVEDDQAIADLLKRGLALHAIDCTVTGDGRDGLAAWMSQPFDVVVLDVMLPGSDGIELLAERRAAGDRTPVILLTAHDDDRIRQRGAEAGAEAFLVKPFAYFELLACLDKLTLDAASAVLPDARPERAAPAPIEAVLPPHRDLRSVQLVPEAMHAEVATSARGHAKANGRNFMENVLRGRYAVPLLAALLIAFAGIASSLSKPSTTLQPTGAAPTAGAPAGLSAVLGTPQSYADLGIAEPSGVAFNAQSGTLFVVGDEGSLAEIDRNGSILRSQVLEEGAEDVAVHAPSGQLVVLNEASSELLVLDLGSLAEHRRFKLDREELLGEAPTGDANTGFEGLAFRPDPTLPTGGLWYLTHQRLPGMVVVVSFDPTGQPGVIGAAEVVTRWSVSDYEVNGITYAPALDVLLVVADHEDQLLVFESDGQLRAALPLPGDQQEGVAVHDDGTIWIADDRGGSVLAFPGGVTRIGDFLAAAKASGPPSP